MGKNELVSLSILYGGKKHAYAINALVKRFSLEKWTTISKASIYNCLGRLEKKMLVEVEHVKVGNMPERKVYNLTEKGEESLAEEIRDALLCYDETFEMFSLAILFGLGISGREMISLLKQKRKQVLETIRKKTEFAQELKGHGITHAVIMLRCGIDNMHRVIQSTDEIIEMLEKDPDYYLKNMEKFRIIYGTEEP